MKKQQGMRQWFRSDRRQGRISISSNVAKIINAATLATWLATNGDTVVVDVARHAVFRKNHHGEHLIAYAGTAFVFGIGSRQRACPLLLVTLVTYAGLLETLQLFVPGRRSQGSDFLYSAAGIFGGLVIAKALQAQFRQARVTAAHDNEKKS